MNMNNTLPTMCEFSVVIPTFNRSRLVRRAIESALNQTLPAKQIIVVDDGSTDDTDDVCQKYGKAIEYVRQTNAGVSVARNQGVSLARHPWTAFLDSDDYWAPTHLEKMAVAIQGTSGKACFYFADMQFPGANEGNTLWAKIGLKISGPYLLAQDGTDWMMMPWQPCAPPCSVFNTGTLKASGGFDSHYRIREDTEIFCRLGIGASVCAVNSVGCIQTSDDNQNNRLTGIMHAGSVSYWEQECLLCKALLARFPNLEQSYKRVLRYKLAAAHWRLTRLQLRAGRIVRSAKNCLQSAMAEPAFMRWLIFHGKSSGWESKVFPIRSSNMVLTDNDEIPRTKEKWQNSGSSQDIPAASPAGVSDKVWPVESRNIKFSVIIPTYNRAKYVLLAVNSVLKQKCGDVEIIVVDDGSEDETASVLQRSNLDIKYIYQRNQGVSGARNTGIREATGEWVAFLDSDDEWHPDYLSRQRELLAKYAASVAVVLNAEDQSDPQGAVDKFSESGMLARLGGNRDMFAAAPFQDVVRHHITTLDCCIFHRKTLLATRLFDEALSIGEDYDIFLQMALQGPFVFCSDMGAFIHRREESIMNLSAQLYKTGLKARLSWARVFDRFLQNNRLLESERKAVCFKYSRNQRALGNLYLRVGDKAKAREAYKHAWLLRPSIESAARLALAYLPFRIGNLFLHKEGNVSPGFVRVL